MVADPASPQTLILEVLLEQFPEQFAAVIELNQFTEAHRPSERPSDDLAGSLLMRIYARGSKTFRASLHLSCLGYGVPAGMLNRSLFEDTIIAHWVKLNPDSAGPMIDRADKYEHEKWRVALEKHGRSDERELPPLTEDERKELSRDFRGGRTWTGLNLYELVKAVEGEWSEPLDRALLWQTHDFVQLFNNQLIHQTPIALRLVSKVDDVHKVVTWDVGNSNTHIHGALAGAFWSYSNLASLVLKVDELEALLELFNRHLTAFTSTRETDQRETDQMQDDI